MTSCSQNRHATNCVIFRTHYLERSRIRTYDWLNQTDLQSATLNHSVILSHKNSYFNINLLVRLFTRFIFLGLQPLCADKL